VTPAITRRKCAVFDWRAAVARAEFALAMPPAREWIRRHAPVGLVIARFALPSDLARPQNAMRRARVWERVENRRAILELLRLQLAWQYGSIPVREVYAAGCTLALPLESRAQIRAIRFSAAESDQYADSAKTAIDCLLPSRTISRKTGPARVDGLGLIRDDRGSVCDVAQWWEPARRGEGFLYLEVRA